MVELILFTVSVLPIVLLGKFIYEKDHNKEPAKLLIKLFLGGIFSCFLVVIATAIIGIFYPKAWSELGELNFIELIVQAFIIVALVEEGCKLFMVYIISYNDKEFEQLYDMIIYSVFVALGFAFFENLTYVYDGGLATGIVRSISAVPAHACFGAIMGYYLGLAKLEKLNDRKELKNKYLTFSLLVPVVLHGIYDYCLFIGNIFFVVIFFVFVFLMYVNILKKVKQVASINRKMKYKDNYCTKCGRLVDSNFCPTCGKKNE